MAKNFNLNKCPVEQSLEIPPSQLKVAVNLEVTSPARQQIVQGIIEITGITQDQNINLTATPNIANRSENCSSLPVLDEAIQIRIEQFNDETNRFEEIGIPPFIVEPRKKSFFKPSNLGPKTGIVKGLFRIEAAYFPNGMNCKSYQQFKIK